MAASLAELLRAYFNLSQLASEILASATFLALTLFAAWLFYYVFRRYFAGWAEKTKTDLDGEILRNIRAPIFFLAFLVGAYYGLNSLTFLEAYSELLTATFAVAEILLVTFILTRMINVLVSWYASRSVKRRTLVSHHLLFILRRFIHAFIYLFAFLAILVTFKIDLSGVVVGLGVGGIAIALALQNVLTDVFSAFSIYFDRPFEIGDFIVIGEYSGTVKKIGIKSTRLQLLHGEELIISNKELTGAKVRNFRKLKKRRVVFTVGVACSTPLEKLKKIPAMITRIVSSMELVEFDRVHFSEFGDFSFNFLVVYYMKTDNYKKYMDIKQEINFAILEAFKQEDIEAAFPTQIIYLKRQNSPHSLERQL